MTKILIACDSFKDCMTADEACKAIEKGVKKAGFKNYISVPLADGGEGTSDVLIRDSEYKEYYTVVKNSIGKNKNTTLRILKNETAIIEIAKICGIEELSFCDRNPFETTTYGVGELILYALDKGIRKFIITLGGSSTNEGGIGMLQALGAQVHVHNQNIKECFKGKHLPYLESINFETIDKRIYECSLQIICDVQNPLLGDEGATMVYSHQKGANKSMQLQLEEGMGNYARIVYDTFGICSSISKTGAAGGLSMAFLVLRATLLSGVDAILHHLDMSEKIKKCDFIITGEGSIDNQSAKGKVISGVIKTAKVYNKPVIAFCGKLGNDIDDLYELGLYSAYSISPGAMSLQSALKNGQSNLKDCVFNVMKLLKLIV